MVSMVAGVLAGWMVARLALSRLRDDLEMTNRRLKMQSMELERERFSLSRTRLQDHVADEDVSSLHADPANLDTGLRDEFQELQLENELLRSEYEDERSALRERIALLEGELAQQSARQEAVFEDVVEEGNFADVEDALAEESRSYEVDDTQEQDAVAEEDRVANEVVANEVVAPPATFHFDVHWVRPPAPRPPVKKEHAPRFDMPVFEPVINVMTGATVSEQTTGQALRSLLALDEPSFAVLRKAGYADVERIAQLTPAEVDTLSELLGIPAARMEMRWIPDAQMAQFSPEFSPDHSS